MTKVVIGLSGGVDSAVSAYLLKQQGYQVKGIFMQNWQDSTDEYCTIKEDSLDAIAVADKLNIDIDIVNFAQEYKDNVFKYFLEEYKQGRTPNPDIFCNSEIKFKAFLNYALKTGANYIATGHYANIEQNPIRLAKATDTNKDQTYFLYRLSETQLEKSIFPLGGLTKPQVREIAHSLDLPNASKKDSTGICFIGERPFRDFLAQYMPNNPGDIIDPNNNIVGKHLGLMYYTIGQRKGLGIGGLGKPWFVAKKNLIDNQLIAVQGHDHPWLYSNYLSASNLSFIHKTNPPQGEYTAKIRYRMQEAKCYLSYKSNHTIELKFNEAQWAVTSGQSVVLYKDNLCIGGGIID